MIKNLSFLDGSGGFFCCRTRNQSSLQLGLRFWIRCRGGGGVAARGVAASFEDNVVSCTERSGSVHRLWNPSVLDDPSGVLNLPFLKDSRGLNSLNGNAFC